MRPGAVDIVVTKGGAFREVFRWTRRTPPSTRIVPVALADGAARAQIRVRGAVLTLDSDAGTDPDGSITLADDGSIELHATADVVATLVAGEGDWSLEVEPADEDRVVLLAGRATIVAEVTL